MLGGDMVREPEPTPSQIRGPVPGHGEPASHWPRDRLGAKNPLGSGCSPSVTGSREGSLGRLGVPRCQAACFPHPQPPHHVRGGGEQG